MAKTLLSVITCHAYAYQPGDVGAAHTNGEQVLRSGAIRNTWYKDWLNYQDVFDLKFFYGRFPEGKERPLQDNEVLLDVPDGYHYLPSKVQAMFDWSLAHKYEHTVKLDDDVFLYVANLAKEKPAAYKGYSCGWFASGAAYWLNRENMQRIVNEPLTPEIHVEDQWVGKTLEKYGVQPEHDERYQICHCTICLKKVSKDNRLTVHTDKPERMYELFNAR